MKYTQVYLDAIGYELPPVVVTTQELEQRLRPVYQALRMPEGQLESLTGIIERRWWEPGTSLASGAVRAARKAIDASGVPPEAIEVVIYAAVCRENFEPATACRVASELGLHPNTVYDISNACLGVLNGILDLANRIELGQIRAGLVVSCETAREINNAMIERLIAKGDMETFKNVLATLTGGSAQWQSWLPMGRSRKTRAVVCSARPRVPRRSIMACVAGASKPSSPPPSRS